MPPDSLGQVVVLPTPLMRRTLLQQQHQLRMRRRKVKIAVAGACLAGLMAWFLAIALEPTESAPGEDSGEVGDESPFHASHGGQGVADGPAWFSTLGGGARAADTR